MNNDHAQLLKLSAKKDQVAFKKLYDETSPVLFALALRLLQQRHLAEECTQEAYLKIWEKAGTFDGAKSHPITWMYTITKNTALDKIRARKTRPQQHLVEEYDLSQITTTTLTPDSTLSIGNEIKRFFSSLNEMKPKQKECLFLFCYYGHTHQELSQKLGIPLGTVKAWIRRGKQQLLTSQSQDALIH